MAISNQILNSALFDQVEPGEAQVLLGYGHELHYSVDEVLDLATVSAGQQLLLVLEGSIAVCKNLNDSTWPPLIAESLKPMELQHLSPGDCHGSLFIDQQSSSTLTLIARCPSRVLWLDTLSLKIFFQQHEAAYAQMLMNLLVIEQRKLQSAIGLIARIHRDEKILMRFPLFGARKHA